MVGRRTLVFEDLPSVMRDVDALQADGYTKTGEWDLSLTCAPLADWMAFPVSGYPRMPLRMRPMLWLFRTMAGRRKLDEILTGGTHPAGMRTAPSTVHPADLDESAAVARLCETVERFRLHEGRYHASPLFGDLDEDTHLRIQLFHCAHHLGFLIPSK